MDEVLDGDGKAASGLDHERAGELVAVAEPDAWFTYYYWLDDAPRARLRARAWTSTASPATTRPSCSWTRPTRWSRPRAGLALARKKARPALHDERGPAGPGARCAARHGRLPDDPADGPVLLCGDPAGKRDRVAAHDVRDLVLELAGLPGGA